MLADDRRDDVVDVGNVTRALLRARAGRRRAARPTAARTRAATIGTPPATTTSSARAERSREVVLEHAPARRGGARLEDGPDAAIRDNRSAAPPASRAPRSDDARNRRAPSRRRAAPTISSRRLMPLNAPQAVGQRRRVDARRSCRRRSPPARCGRCARRAAAMRTGRTARPSRRTLKCVRPSAVLDVASPASRRHRPGPNVSTGLTA